MKRFLLALLALSWTTALTADPKPGDLYREFTYLNRFGEVDPGSTRPGIDNMRAASMAPRIVDLPGLGNVVRAEVSVEYWGGHIGTSEQKFRVNGNDWLAIQQPSGTPGTPQCYHRRLLGRATTPVPVSELKRGPNEFRFTAGPQLCYSFNWGFYWVYSFTVRLYYSPNDTDRPDGELLLRPGSEIGENPMIAAAAAPRGATITRVDFLGKYEDFNWEGDGKFRQWHYTTERGNLTHHIGTATAPPYAVRWDTTWIPDQDQPVELAARITDSSGRMFLTPAVEVRFRRNGRSVKMYKPANVPEAFGVRVGRRKECTFQLPDNLSAARSARIVLSTWSAAHADRIGWNDTKLADRVGFVHNYSFDAIPVPLKILKPGVNTFFIFSDTKEHAAEVNWPGPVLLVDYASPTSSAAARIAPVSVTELKDFEGQPSFEIRTPLATYVYQKEAAALASIKDASGAEWIGYHPGGRSAGEFRGIPNFGHQFGHPGNRGAVTKVTLRNPEHVRLHSRSRDGRWECEWDFFASHATMTLRKAVTPYWFLYEGTPAGKLDLEHGYQVLSTGEVRELNARWSGPIAGAPWLYFGDRNSRYALFVAAHQEGDVPVQYWQMDRNMTVFGFGRELTCCRQFLTAVPAKFSIGIAENTGFDALSRLIRSAVATPAE